MPCVNLGPSEYDFWRTCLSGGRGPHVWALAAATVFAFLAVCLSCDHLRRLGAAPISKQREYYQRLARTPLVFAVSSHAALVSPRTWLLWDLVQKSYEAYALAAFGRLLLLLLVREVRQQGQPPPAGPTPARGGGGGHQAAAPSTEAMTCLADGGDHCRALATLEPQTFYTPLRGQADDSIATRVMEALQMQGPQKHFATLPVLCLCRPCLPKHEIAPKHLICVTWSLSQFVVLVPALSILSLWARLALPGPQEAAHEFGWAGLSAPQVSAAAALVQRVSNLVALQGLFIVYKVSHDVLHPWSTTLKFMALKAVLILDMLQVPIIEAIMRQTEQEDDAGLDGGCLLRGKNAAMFWSMGLLAMESLLMAALVRRAFPAEEVLEGADGLRGLDEADLVRAAAAKGARRAKAGGAAGQP